MFVRLLGTYRGSAPSWLKGLILPTVSDGFHRDWELKVDEHQRILPAHLNDKDKS